MAVADHMRPLSATIEELKSKSGDRNYALQILTDSVAEVIGLVDSMPFAALLNASQADLALLNAAAEEKFSSFTPAQKHAIREIAQTKAEIHKIEASFSFLHE